MKRGAYKIYGMDRKTKYYISELLDEVASHAGYGAEMSPVDWTIEDLPKTVQCPPGLISEITDNISTHIQMNTLARFGIDISDKLEVTWVPQTPTLIFVHVDPEELIHANSTLDGEELDAREDALDAADSNWGYVQDDGDLH